MSLVLEIEFLTGAYRAARSPASTTPDWPPQPDRVFSGLVAAWAARGEQSIERLALEWLEAQSAPAIHAGDHTVRTAPGVFVPPNDFQVPENDISKQKWYREYLARGQRPPKNGGHQHQWQRAIASFPNYRQQQRQERRFPVAVLDDPVMAMVWAADPEPKLLATLDALARDVGYIGHSASLVRCRFLARSSPAPKHVAVPAARQVYPGRFAELRRAYRLKPARPVILPGAVVLPQPAAPAPAQADWLVLEAIGGSVPDIRAAALVARTLRRRLMGGYRGIGMADEIPEAVSGHTPDGSPTRASHLAIAPLAFAGYPHADGRVFGFALIPSAQMVLRDVPGLGAAFEKVAPYDSGAERRVLELRCVPHQPLQLCPAGESSKRSLMPGPYLQPARVWASVTPVVLDRHLKGYDEGKIRELIADSCANVGLPRPDPDRIQVGKHAAIAGVPSAWPRPGAPPWSRWHVPEALRSRLLTHVAIDFGCEVAGPVMLGTGRYMGLGLCRRLVGTAG